MNTFQTIHFGEIPISKKEIPHLKPELYLHLPFYEDTYEKWESNRQMILNAKGNAKTLNEIVNKNLKKSYPFGIIKKITSAELKKFENETIPLLFELALIHPTLFPEPLLLTQKKTHSVIKLTRLQIASLLSLAYLGLFPALTEFRDTTYFPQLFYGTGGKIHATKLRALMAYYEGILHFIKNDRNKLNEEVFIERNTLKEIPNWKELNIPIDTSVIVDDDGLIEEKTDCLEADFANKYIGGGVLNMGLVQEEIAFVKCTESLVSILFCPGMSPKDTIRMYNVLSYSDGTGYSNNYSFTKAVYQENISHNWVALDALKGKDRKDEQYLPCGIERELNKVYCAVQQGEFEEKSELPHFASGKWGSGAYHGDMRLKFIIQLCACTLAQRTLIYHSFHDKQFGDEIRNFVVKLKENKPTISQLYHYMVNLRSKQFLTDFDHLPHSK